MTGKRSLRYRSAADDMRAYALEALARDRAAVGEGHRGHLVRRRAAGR